ncbi:hypothetical protein PP409_gp28 [Vibrio phage Seahorse]|uniref:NlpC/P60 domain-containing protein n=1 Tax=Vibrio phage Seahorse TaxID=2662136 RepID=A0A6B7SEA2_9CAUD|nr:hypothetical protein PP409_gp28 [Vibrio phage Seahorse]QGF20994.1 hypothetical protein [Vibrio phage Seahorse]
MNLVGKHYSKKNYNCAHFVSDWYKEKLGIEVPVINEFGLSFVVWMKRHFNEITKPCEHCLVLMINLDGSYHIGVYHDLGVWHNFNPSVGSGSVVKWTLGSVNSYYKKVSFHEWSK